eukprot:CAMPEP_0168615604 /NCGR_PEP_ID=MMETSP0449_2-20121227/4589_1 /TAXON_ID=1082188 /ORGANISM="Strombidium rassoulzadegani, Strain ras09" /LENGTH=73 /DNA_ID=CAMNT_0008656347 /DNA_START=15 /DNA_END=236 /DNA_ORIENTATION=+
MKDLIRGTVRSHKIPGDYKYGLVQPTLSRPFLTYLKKVILQKLILKQYAAVPLFVFFGFGCPLFLTSSYIKYK